MKKIDHQSLIVAAREWIGTPFHHQGRVKSANGIRGGVDCLGLLIGVAKELDLHVASIPLATLDSKQYGHIPDGDALEYALRKWLMPVTDPRAGDIALMRFDGNPQHLGIISNYPNDGLGLIHAYAHARKVVEHSFNDEWKEKVVVLFRIF